MNVQRIIDRERQRIIDELFPDTCQLFPDASTNVTIDATGHLNQDAKVARTYLGSKNIPCRADMARAFRPDRIKEQVLVTDEFGLELPFDCPVEEGDEVLLDGKRFQIRRLKASSNWDFTIEALIMHITTPYD